MGHRLLLDDVYITASPATIPTRWDSHQPARSRLTPATIAATSGGEPALFKIPGDGGTPQLLVRGQARDPAWAPSGRFIVYSGADVGMTFQIKAVTEDGHPTSCQISR